MHPKMKYFHVQMLSITKRFVSLVYIGHKVLVGTGHDPIQGNKNNRAAREETLSGWPESALIWRSADLLYYIWS